VTSTGHVPVCMLDLVFRNMWSYKWLVHQCLVYVTIYRSKPKRDGTWTNLVKSDCDTEFMLGSTAVNCSGTDFSQSTSVLPCHHFTSAPY
jgi:hypothetical protein